MTDTIPKMFSEAVRKRETKLLHIEPPYLVFPPPHNDRCIQNVLYLYNASSSYCVYKLYSHHPEYYNAKPNIATIAPRTVVRIWIILRATGSQDFKFAPDYVDKFHLCVKVFPSMETALTVTPQDAWKQAGENVDHRYIIKAYFSSNVSIPENMSISFHPPSHAGAKVQEMKESLLQKRASSQRVVAKEPVPHESDIEGEIQKKSSIFLRFLKFFLFLAKVFLLLSILGALVLLVFCARKVWLSEDPMNLPGIWSEMERLLVAAHQSPVWQRFVHHQKELRSLMQQYIVKVVAYVDAYIENRTSEIPENK